MKLITSLLLIEVAVTSAGCGTTASFGVGTNLSGRIHNGEKILDRGELLGIFRVETPRWYGISGEYYHASNLSGHDYGVTTDNVSANLTFAIGKKGESVISLAK